MGHIHELSFFLFRANEFSIIKEPFLCNQWDHFLSRVYYEQQFLPCNALQPFDFTCLMKLTVPNEVQTIQA
jgi:hypothetical protein